jgi:hypothetical protein
MTHLHSCIRPSVNTHPKFSERNANQNSQKLYPTTKFIELRAVKGNEKSPWRGSHEFCNQRERETKSHLHEV